MKSYNQSKTYNALLNGEMGATEFKQRWPRLYKHIIETYGGKRRVHDVIAAIATWFRKESYPACDMCGKQLILTKKFRVEGVAKRCLPHSKAVDPVSLETLLSACPPHISIDRTSLRDVISKGNSVKFVCSEHGSYMQGAGYFLNGGSCAKCYDKEKLGKAKKPIDKWIADSTAAHNGKYDYSNVNFVNTTRDVTITCPVHGAFVQNAGVHSRGHGCPKCADEINSERRMMSTNEFIRKAKLKHGDLYDYAKTNYKGARTHVTITCNKHGDFEQVPYYHLQGNGCQKCGLEQCTYKSAPEYEILDFLKENGITDAEHSNQELGFELDIYIPSRKLAIEYNGVYWHSSGCKENDARLSKQHLFKTTKCEENGISLLHILDLEWTDPVKKEIWKSTILHKLGLSKERIYARKCSIVLVPHKATVEFFAENHLQGSASSAINIGLQYEGRIVAIGAFSKSRYSKDKSAYELIRFASVRGASVVGGFQKIIKEFAKTHQGTLISYANRRWSQGNVYKASNFTVASISGPCYYYTNCKTLQHRSVYQKHKLKDLLPNFDPALSEVENMYNHKFRRIWDCGHLVFHLDLNK